MSVVILQVNSDRLGRIQKKMGFLKFEPIVGSQAQTYALYELLKERKHSISNKGATSFVQHKQFVQNHPYRFWYLISVSDTYCGSIYFTFDNLIGVNVSDWYIERYLLDTLCWAMTKHTPLPSIPSVRDEVFSINVPTSNQAMVMSLKLHGFELSQLTFRLTL